MSDSPCRARSSASRAAALACALLFATLGAACGGGGKPGTGNPDGGVACTHNFDCPAGSACVGGVCAVQPCGGCQPDEACSDNGGCVPAQGAKCPAAGCPTAYPCNGKICAKKCTLDGDCDKGSVCNSALGTCAQCTFDSNCAAVPGKPRCDSTTGVCVACTQPADCGAGHFCDPAAHVCVTGCKVDNDCNVSGGERCDGATTSGPGRCIQCKLDSECVAPNPACDATGHCVGCTSNNFCSSGLGSAQECDPTTKTCVVCETANNSSGVDCGVSIPNANPHDPHNASTCNPATHSCVPGCASDAQCGCPRDQNGAEVRCSRYQVAEHCDPNATKDASGSPSLGACVQCAFGATNANGQCSYLVAPNGSLNGARCLPDDKCHEGCDTDQDCPASKLCHHGKAGDPNNNKCVSCSCDGQTINDNAWCQDTVDCPDVVVKQNGQPDAHYPRVCDSQTLLCRHKRFNETCGDTSECGDNGDPAVQEQGSTACLPVPALCVKQFMPGTTGAFTQCRAAPGRCGIPCSDIYNNYCAGSGLCPYNSRCRSAQDLNGGTGKYCIPGGC